MAIGDEEPINCRPADLIPSGYGKAVAEIGRMARSEEDILSYALFPQVAREFLQRRRESEIQSSRIKIQKSKPPSPWKIAGRFAALDRRL